MFNTRIALFEIDLSNASKLGNWNASLSPEGLSCTKATLRNRIDLRREGMHERGVVGRLCVSCPYNGQKDSRYTGPRRSVARSLADLPRDWMQS